MAKHTEVYLTCDMAVGSSGAKCGQKVEGETQKFSIGERSFEIDLCEKHRDQFENAIGKFVMSAEETKQARVAKAQIRRAVKGKPGTFTTKDVREWLAAQGIEVSPTGRLSQSLIDQYQDAHA